MAGMSGVHINWLHYVLYAAARILFRPLAEWSPLLVAPAAVDVTRSRTQSRDCFTWIWCIIKHSLYFKRWLTGSQCRSFNNGGSLITWSCPCECSCVLCPQEVADVRNDRCASRRLQLNIGISTTNLTLSVSDWYYGAWPRCPVCWANNEVTCQPCHE